MQTQKVNSMDPVYNKYDRVTPEKLLDETVFYKLLITQLKNQDPLSPMKPEDFTAQLAQLSQLEEARKLNDYMRLMSAGLIGKEITTTSSDQSRKVTGIEVDQKEHKVMLDLDDGSTADLKDIKSITFTNLKKQGGVKND